jgi:hypothetical protein
VLASQALEVVVNDATGAIVEVTPASPEVGSRARGKAAVSLFPRNSLPTHGVQQRQADKERLGLPTPPWVSHTSRPQIQAELGAGLTAFDNHLGLRKRFGVREPTITTPATKLAPAVLTEPHYRRFVVRARAAPAVEDGAAAAERQAAELAAAGLLETSGAVHTGTGAAGGGGGGTGTAASGTAALAYALAAEGGRAMEGPWLPPPQSPGPRRGFAGATGRGTARSGLVNGEEEGRWDAWGEAREGGGSTSRRERAGGASGRASREVGLGDNVVRR